jgi:hypothetical protein
MAEKSVDLLEINIVHLDDSADLDRVRPVIACIIADAVEND